MAEKIIYIMGPASDVNKIACEQQHFKASILSLEESGATVIAVGNPETGFSIKELAAAFAENQRTAAIIVNMHGSIIDAKHQMIFSGRASSKRQGLWADDFYSALAHFSNNRPVSIFMLSCGSGNGLKDAQKLLPEGSMVFNLAAPNRGDSPFIAAESLSISGAPGLSVAERLLASILCRGLSPSLRECHPTITMVTDKKEAGKINDLWDAAASLSCSWASQKGAAEAFMSNAALLLKPYLPAKLLSAAQLMLECYGEIERASDRENFRRGMFAVGMSGPICALAYAAMRGEFSPIERPMIQPECTPLNPLS